MVSGSAASISLGPRCQVADFPEETFKGSGIDFGQFRGTIKVEASVPIVGMAIRVSQEEFATLLTVPVRD
jgi:hypothetical protein